MVLLAAGASIYYSIICNDYSWFSRAGSLITISGLLLTLKHHILSSSRNINTVMLEKFHYAVYAPSEGTERYRQDKSAAMKIMRDEYIGVIITVIGTVIWGYGDLVEKLFI